ncbi:inward rectifier potassium channel [Holotrichia oblita]|uniref:Inward rectifier potassium channel n=1 Tax=Holotrichia oblita TaxID=644536 RepID=A0ACB9SP35_HOLOL|nr:inward rectifier potassium channel [Holotrichia oblita]
MPDELKIENEKDGSPATAHHQAEQWEKLLGNGKATIVVSPAQNVVATKENRTGGVLGTFHRHFRIGGGTGTKKDDSPRHVFSRYRQSRFNARRIRKRVVFKHGDCNVVQGNVAKRRRKYLQDIFTTLVDAQWRWTLLVFAMNFLLSWLSFAIIWWLISYTHGDLDLENMHNETWTPCVSNIKGFTSCFLFSVETQHTIGYGGRTTTEECPEAIFVMCVQSISGVMIQAFMVGVVFAKLSRPKKRTQTLLFSRHAVICHRDGVPCLMFRVGDMRKSHIIEAHVRAQLIRHKVTKEGESLPFFQTELKVGGDGEEDKIFFIWPTTIVHKIDRYSPLYTMSATDLLRERFEIVVILGKKKLVNSIKLIGAQREAILINDKLKGCFRSALHKMVDKIVVIPVNARLHGIIYFIIILYCFVIAEGVIESTGMTTQARSSYLPSEILWGHRFQSLITFKKDSGEYEVDYALFNNTIEVDTPLCSAKKLDEHKAALSIDCGAEPLHSDTFPHRRYQSSDTLCSMDSMSDVEIRIPASPIPPVTITTTIPESTSQHFQNGCTKFFKNGNAQPVPV